jgi:hypothetical protein
MASQDTLSQPDSFQNIDSLLENTPSGIFSTNTTNNDNASSDSTESNHHLTSSIHQYTRKPSKADKLRTKKRYLCAQCVPSDPKGWHTATDGLKGHLKKAHGIIWTAAENTFRMTPRTEAEESVQEMYDELLKRGGAKGLVGEVLRRTVQKNLVKQTLLDLIIVRRLPFSCVEWPEFHAFVRALNPEADQPDTIPIHHSTITDWIFCNFVESQDIVRRRLQSAKTNIHLAIDIWTCPNHTLLLGVSASFLDSNDQYHNILIGLRTVYSQSGEDMWIALQPILESYGIEKKLGAIIGDNAGTNDVLCRTIATWLTLEHGINWNALHQRIRCQGHILNIIVQAFLHLSAKDQKILESYDKEDEQEYQNAEAEIEEDEEADDEDSEVEEIVIQQQAKTSVKKGRGNGRGRGKGRGKGRGNTREPEPEPEPVIPIIQPAKKEKLSKEARLAERGKKIRSLMGPLGKLHNIVVHIRASANRTTWFVSKAGRCIPLDNRTRWNSWFHMLSVALNDKLRHGLMLYEEQYQQNIAKEDHLTTDDWLQLRTIHDFLQGFHDATLYLEGCRTTLERALSSLATLERLIDNAKVSHIKA